MDIRKKFFEFFESKGHTILPPGPLVPEQEDSTMFTIAGMKQFTEIFLGKAQPQYSRVVTIQPCLRVGGKQNDIDCVGKTTRHHTFFEMMGNFSFYDYFKEEAISYAYQFLTEELALGKEYLHFTVYYKDTESAELWKKITGKDAILIDTEDNFWRSGEFGPCGPCTEIYYDKERERDVAQSDIKNLIEKGDDRFLEVWNLVFMESNNTPQGLEPLAKKSVDTGMGLERISSVLLGTYDNFLTPTMEPILMEAKCGNNTFSRIVADHMRAICFLLAEDLLPSSNGRGYVLRKLIRRSLKYRQDLSALVPTVCRTLYMYPLLESKQNHIQSILQQEEEFFSQVVNKLASLEKQDINEQSIVKFYHTHGIPIDLSVEYFSSRDVELNMEEIENLVKEHSTTGYSPSVAHDKPTVIRAYENLETLESKIVFLADQDNHEIKTSSDRCIILTESSNFYARGGGQAGDQGKFFTETGSGTVEDTLRQKVTQNDYLVLHVCKVEKGYVELGQLIDLHMNREVRRSRARAHSATHLLCDHLFKNYHVVQCGSSVESDRFTFDYNAEAKFLPLEEINRQINQMIKESLASKIYVEDAELVKDARKLTGSYYGSKVRVVEFPNISKQLCGGTHVENTADIEQFLIIKDTSLKRGVRRLEVLTGEQNIENYGKSSHAHQKKKEGLDYRLTKVDQLLLIEILSGEQNKVYGLMDSFKKEYGRIIAFQGLGETARVFVWGILEEELSKILSESVFKGKYMPGKISSFSLDKNIDLTQLMPRESET